MKSVLLASALMISGVAFAQADPRDAGQPIGSGATMQPGTTMGERDTMGPQSTTMPPAATATPPATTEPAPMPPASATTDTTTMGTMGTTGSGTVMVQQGGNMTPPPTDTGPYPRCSRTVTDHCQQSSARESDTKGGPPKHRRTRR
jgi:hypothetical protein